MKPDFPARIATLAFFLTASLHGQAVPLDENPATADPVVSPSASIKPATSTEREGQSGSVQWRSLFKQSLFFLSVEHGFRLATDPNTREFAGGSFFGGYVNSVGNLHGWADGDPFIVNYVGHPIQGAVSGFIWIHNDPRYRTAEFGRNRRYWTGRLRAMAFAWAYSEQFEIGPISEASIGHVQAYFPQQGFVDHVITPTVGMGWMIAEDAVDHYVIRRIEARTGNRWIRMFARGMLNPSRAFANCMALETPWHREDRPGITQPYLQSYLPVDVRPRNTSSTGEAGHEPIAMAPFEFTTSFNSTVLGAGKENLNCIGGEGDAVWNRSRIVGIEAQVGGCKMVGLTTNLSGDSTTFTIGPRFTYRSGSGRWNSWAHVLVGGEKLTQELLLPALEAEVVAAAPPNTSKYILHDAYTQHSEATGFAMTVGSGVDWTLNREVAFRVGSIEYLHSWTPRLNDQTYANDVKVSAGFILRAGG